MVAQKSPITPNSYQHYPHTTPKYIYFLLIRGDGRRDSGIGFLEYVTCDQQSPTSLGDVQNEFIADKPLPSGKSKGPVSRRRTPLQMGYVTAATDSNRKMLFQSLTLSRTPSGVKYWWCPGLGSMILCLKKIPLISTPFLLMDLMVQSKNFVSWFDFLLEMYIALVTVIYFGGHIQLCWGRTPGSVSGSFLWFRKTYGVVGSESGQICAMQVPSLLYYPSSLTIGFKQIRS